VEGLSEFTVVSINDNTIIGAYAVEEQPSGRVIGRNLRMSRSQADMLQVRAAACLPDGERQS
jgi:hypothetical protein